MAAVTPRLRLTVVGTREFPELARQARVSVVPLLVIGGGIAIDGGPPEDILLARMLEAVR